MQSPPADAGGKTLHHHMVAWRKIQRSRKGNWLCACARDLKSICNMYIYILYIYILIYSLYHLISLFAYQYLDAFDQTLGVFCCRKFPAFLRANSLPAAVRFWAKTIQDSCDESCGIVLRFFVDFAIAGSSVNAKMWGIQTDATGGTCGKHLAAVLLNTAMLRELHLSLHHFGCSKLAGKGRNLALAHSTPLKLLTCCLLENILVWIYMII